VTTFPVHEVESATSLVRQISYQQAVEDYLLAERRIDGLEKQTLEACSLREVGLVSGITHHPLVAALELAYAGHRPVALSPDMIWLLICQGVAHHLAANVDELRHQFVAHPGRLTLELNPQDPAFPKGSPDNPWPEVIADFSRQIASQIGPWHDLFLPSFSTTGDVERVAAEIALLDSMQRYFHYLLTSMNSGIPSVTLEGTPTDWQAVGDRAEAFAPLGLDWWLSPLRRVLRQFARAACGEVDRPFWESIYRIQPLEESSHSASTLGWIGVLFPYLNDPQGLPTVCNPWLSGERDLDEPFHLDRAGARRRVSSEREPGYLFEAQFPSGLARAPFTWDERDRSGQRTRRWDMELLGGFVGVTQEAETLRLRPEIGWAVRERGRNE